MRAQAGNGTRYYQDTTRLQRTGTCDQSMIRADEIEEKVAQILMDLQVPDEWDEKALSVCSPEETERLAEEEQRVKEQLARIRRLFVEGDVGYKEYQQEKHCLHWQWAECKYLTILTTSSIILLVKMQRRASRLFTSPGPISLTFSPAKVTL